MQKVNQDLEDVLDAAFKVEDMKKACRNGN